MGEQAAIFIASEGDEWHRRNLDKGRMLPVVDMSEYVDKITSAVEFGCGAGLNIGEIQYQRGCAALGIDPSSEAISFAREKYPKAKFLQGTANYHFLDRGGHDLLVYGFCLYLCDRESLQSIVSIADNALRDGGHIIIQDFDPEYPHRVPYHHVPGMFSYKMDHSKLWLANPAYSLVRKEVYADGEAVWLLKKDTKAGWGKAEPL